MNKRIVAFGNPLLDTIVLVNDDFLLRKNNLKRDGQKEISHDEMISLKEDIKNYEKTVTAGGCGQNTLRVLQWLLQKQCLATMIGGIGNDEEGMLLKEILTKHGVETSYILNNGYSTGTTISLVSGDNRSLVAHLGAAETVPLSLIQKNSHIMTRLQMADLIYMEGFFLTKRENAASFVLHYCNNLNKEFAFNLSGEYLCRENAETVQYFVKRADVIFGNKKEFEALVSIMNENSAEDLVKSLGEKGKTVAMTNGSNSVLSISGVDRQLVELEVPNLKTEEIVDTTGAGDAFAAGFLRGYLMKKSIKTCVEFGCYAAQEIIKRRGCTVPEYSPQLIICT